MSSFYEWDADTLGAQKGTFFQIIPLNVLGIFLLVLMNEVFIDGSSTLFNVNVFPMEAILKHKQVVCMRRKLLFSIFKYLFSLIKYDEKISLSHFFNV